MRTNLKVVTLALVTALAAGCAVLAPGTLKPGTSITEARKVLGGPRAEYPLPDGGTRLEFRQGRQTWMLDFDAGGTLVRNQQVLTEANFAKILPGLTRQQVLMRIGHPVEITPVGWQRLHVWNYRFYPGDCVWFRVSISDTSGGVTETSMGMDPACDGGSRIR